MCTIVSSYPRDTTCKRKGSYKNLFVMKGTDLATGTATYNPNTHTITAFTGLPTNSVAQIVVETNLTGNVYEINGDDGADAFEQIVTAVRGSMGGINKQLANDLKACCDLVAVIEDNAGNVHLIGINDPIVTAPTGNDYSFTGLRFGFSGSTGDSASARPSFTARLQAGDGRADVYAIDLSPSAFATFKAAVIPL